MTSRPRAEGWRASRRTVLKGAVLIGVVPALGFTTITCASALRDDPFTLGVASGDPAPDGAVIWTRLAPRPLAADGLGGMPDRVVEVDWEALAIPPLPEGDLLQSGEAVRLRWRDRFLEQVLVPTSDSRTLRAGRSEL